MSVRPDIGDVLAARARMLAQAVEQLECGESFDPLGISVRGFDSNRPVSMFSIV